jgi:hypothetical protein
MKKTYRIVLPAVLLLCAAVSYSDAQDHVRATLDASPDATSPEAYQHVRATLGGSSDGRASNNSVVPYSPFHNTLEIGYGGCRFIFNTVDSGGASLSEACSYSELNYIHKFGPHFGMGAGLEGINHSYTETYQYAYYYEAYNTKDTINAYKLLMRFTFIPAQPINLELTLGLGMLTGQEKVSDSWSDNYSSGLYQGTKSSSGTIGSIGVGVRYNITKQLSAGIAGKISDINFAGSVCDLFQYGIFTGLGF